MTDTVPAAATGLPSFDRRSFLSTLIAAGVLSAGTVLPAAATDEHPDAGLLALCAQYEAADAEQDRLDRLGDEAFDRFKSPVVPRALYFRKDQDSWEICHDRERLTEIRINGRWRRVYLEEKDTAALRWKIEQWKKHGTGGRHLARAEEIIAALDIYVPAVTRAEDVAGITENQKASERHTEVTERLLVRIAETPATTSEGVGAKARVVGLYTGHRPGYVERSVLPELLCTPYGPGWRERRKLMLSTSLLVDAMKLGATSAPVSSSARDAA